MTSFAQLAATPCGDHERMALGLASELGGLPDPAALPRLEGLAATLACAIDPHAALEAVRALLVDRLSPDPSGALLLPDVLRARGGHPAGIAVAAASVAARAGSQVGLVGAGDRLYLAHPALEEPVVIDPARPGDQLDARTLQAELRWRCAHQSCWCVLERAARRAEREGDLTTALHAASLRLALPLDDDAIAAAQREHLRLAARLN